jgi:hypothetical protein
MWIDERTLHNPVLEVRADAVIDRGPSAVVAIAARKSFPHRRGEEDGKAHGVEAEQKAPAEREPPHDESGEGADWIAGDVARFRPVPSSGRAPWSNAAPITTAGQPVPRDADGESRCDRGADGDGSALEGDAGQRRLEGS